MTFLLSLYTIAHLQRDGKLRPEVMEITAASPAEAVTIKQALLVERARVIREQARRVVGWTEGDAKRKRAEILHEISWLHATIEAVRV